MRKLIIIMLSFTTMFTGLQAHTLAESPFVNNNIVAGTTIVIEVGPLILMAGPVDAAVPTVSISHNFLHDSGIDRNDFENTLTQMYSQLGINAADHPVIIAEQGFPSKPHREKIAEVLFNKFNVPSIYMANKGVLALYATGRETGTVVHSEYGMSYIITVYRGYILPGAVFQVDIGGIDLADYTSASLKNKGIDVSREVAADMNNKLGYLVLDTREEMQKPVSSISKSYTHNGKQITVGQERFLAPELLFQPSLGGIESNGIHETTYNSIMKCEVDTRRELYANIILSGSNTMFPGIKERMEFNITELASSTMKVVVTALPDRGLLPWKGVKVLSPLLAQYNMWVSKAEFDSKGSAIIHQRFF